MSESEKATERLELEIYVVAGVGRVDVTPDRLIRIGGLTSRLRREDPG